MSPRARARLIAVVTVVLGLALAAGLALYGLSSRITYFHSPSEIIGGALNQKQMAHTIRVGGLVKTGSVQRTGDTVAFVITDNAADMPVTYRGVLPDLFREGQSVVGYGRYDPQTHLFTASDILAKHDENYMPPEVKKALSASVTPAQAGVHGKERQQQNKRTGGFPPSRE